MSTLPDNEFDLEKLFLPAWAQEEPSATKYAKYEGEEDRPDRRREGRGQRRPRREGQTGQRRTDSRPAELRGRPGQEPGRDRGANRDRGNRRGPRRMEPRERREPPPPLPEIDVTLVPEEKGVESLARQIKIAGRAYPLFDISQMILQKPERHTVVFKVRKNAEERPVQPLFVCALDETLWLSEAEAVRHVLNKHFSTFYQAERTATEPPKGKYTFVAQCGMSGVVLGPPNYHDYQNQLRKLHTERFSRMPFEVYKSRVKIVRDEEVVKKWVEEQSWKTEYLCLNMPEPLRLNNMEAVEKHFRETHKENIIKQVESHTLSGPAARALRSSELTRLVRSVWEDQRRFPLQIATLLSQQFASHGLQFFKVNKTITHVAVARPHYLDLALTPVSEGVKSIVDYINANPKSTRRKLVEALAPSPLASPQPVAEPAEAQTAPPPQNVEPTAEQNALNADLHWLIHQGHVIEFANGTLETAKKPVPRPPKPEAKPVPQPAEAESAAVAPATERAGPEQNAVAPAEATQVSPGEDSKPAEVSVSSTELQEPPVSADQTLAAPASSSPGATEPNLETPSSLSTAPGKSDVRNELPAAVESQP